MLIPLMDIIGWQGLAHIIGSSKAEDTLRDDPLLWAVCSTHMGN